MPGGVIEAKIRVCEPIRAGGYVSVPIPVLPPEGPTPPKINSNCASASLSPVCALAVPFLLATTAHDERSRFQPANAADDPHGKTRITVRCLSLLLISPCNLT